jgi:hypothetical protein
VCPAWGTLKNFNTVEEFKTADKQAFFNAEARSVRWHVVAHAPHPLMLYADV